MVVVVVWLTDCRPTDDVLPNVARIQLVLAQNKQTLPIYFLEDSSRNRLALEVYYFDANNSFVTPVAVPTFSVNGKPLAGNTFVFKQAGQFTLTAQVGKRASDNQLVVNVGSAADNIRSFTIQAVVPLLNADSTSRLPLTYEVIDKQGHSLNLLDYPSIKLSVDGALRMNPTGFSTAQAGIYSLQADFLGRKSDILQVTAREPLRYDVVKLPVVIHILAGEDFTRINPTTILAEVNRTFRRSKRSTDPNQADAYIEFVPALVDPDGHPLAVAGLNRLPFSNPTLIDTAVSQVHRVVQHWCPQQYINVFVSLDWQRTYEPGYSYSYGPNRSASSVVTCENIQKLVWPSIGIPAIYIYNNQSFSSLDHELGHFLGLGHTFSPGCSNRGTILDLPQHEKSHPDAKGLKYTCTKIPFISEYTMDYYVPHNSFTYEEVSRMRATLNWASYIPSSSIDQTKRRVAGASGALEEGHIID